MSPSAPHSPFQALLTLESYEFGALVLHSRLVQALQDGISRYPIYRSTRFAARENLETLFDELATTLGWQAHRVHSGSMLLECAGALIACHGGRKSDYCSCSFFVWAESAARADDVLRTIAACVGVRRIAEPMFSIDWHFLTSKGTLESAEIEEMADDVLHDEAYPELAGGVHAFIERYLASDETVLVLQGPPGTGKTRLIRAILGAISRAKGGAARALYTGDKKALESDEIFVKFITGWEDAFVVEDADHLLKPRAEGNENLHRFLAIADGVVRAQGRKIVFSTNLPNVGDLDEALVRPGRCFARVHARLLDTAEAAALAQRLSGGDERRVTALRDAWERDEQRHLSLAAIYKALAAV